MKVLMVTPSFDPIIGGTETYVRELATLLNGRNICTDVMTFNMDRKWKPRYRDEVRECGFKLFRVAAFNPFAVSGINPLTTLFYSRVIPRLSFVKHLREYDIIHFHDDVDLSFPFFSYFVRKPKILHCHTLYNTYIDYARNLLNRELFKRVSDFHMASCNFVLRLLLNLGVPRARIVKVPYAVDTRKFVPERNKKLDNVILYVGRIVRHKGLHVLLKALSYMTCRAELVIIGPVGDVRYFEEIADRMRKIDGICKATYLGCVDEKTKVDWYQKASIFVCPSEMEVFGITNLEALACGTPDVATNVGGIPEVVEDEVNGLLVPPNDPKALASAIQKILEDKKLRDSYGEAGRRIVQQHFSWEIATEEAIKVYEAIFDHSISQAS